MNLFTQTVFLIARVLPEGSVVLGTGFLVSKDGKIATSRHVVGNSDAGLCVLMPHINNFNSYQDTTDNLAQTVQAQVLEVDPIKDLVILKTDLAFEGPLPKIGSLDVCDVGDVVWLFGFPHAVDGRRVLTFQETKIGAKVLLESQGVKAKYSIINTQTRPGQSGSLIFSPKANAVVGVLIGAYGNNSNGGIRIGSINPAELHQTTHCISSEYLLEMI